MFSHQPNLSQRKLIDKINTYFKLINHPLELHIPGCCHGLTLLWLKRMAQNRTHEMFFLIKRIIDQPVDRLHEIDAELKKFAFSIDKKQRPEKYFNNTTQADLDLILHVTEKQTLDGSYLSRGLADFIEGLPKNGLMIAISHKQNYLSKNQPINHTIGLYIILDLFFIYDANYTSGREKCFYNASDVALEIRHCLFHHFNLRPPALIPLKIKTVQASQLPQNRVSFSI